MLFITSHTSDLAWRKRRDRTNHRPVPSLVLSARRSAEPFEDLDALRLPAVLLEQPVEVLVPLPSAFRANERLFDRPQVARGDRVGPNLGRRDLALGDPFPDLHGAIRVGVTDRVG